MIGRQRRQLRELWDRERIRECLRKYARGLDRLDLDLYRLAFAPDGIDNHGSARTPEQFLDQWLPEQERREVTQHFVTNDTIELDGDEAHAESYYFVVVKLINSDQVSLHGGRYADRLVRAGDSWKLAVRVVLPEWHSVVPSVVDSWDVGRTNWRRRSQEDPTYERPLRPR